MLKYIKWIVLGLMAAVPFIRWLMENDFFAGWTPVGTGLACVGIFLLCTLLANLGLFAVQILGGSLLRVVGLRRSAPRRRY